MTHWLGWPVHAQHAAQRNARQRATVLAQRRREREEVDRYLARQFSTGAEGRPAVPKPRDRRSAHDTYGG